jgi:hypothetical protein
MASTGTRDRSLVQAVELWLPQGEVIAFGAGAYRGNDELAAGSEGLRFHYGEGLPGSVWANGRALLWKELKGPFLRAALAAEAGIDAAVGFPLFDGERLIAVVTLLLSRRSEAPGCLEIWDVIDELDVLKLGAGYYLHCAELERISPFIQFARGTGLPGLTWLGAGVEVMEDVRKSNAFIRAGLAASCGLQHGIGIPVYRGRKVVQVLTLFGAEQNSFVTSAELYRPQAGELGASMLFDWSNTGSPRGQSSADAPRRREAEHVLVDRTPLLSQSRTPHGREICLTLPMHDRKGLREVLVLRF